MLLRPQKSLRLLCKIRWKELSNTAPPLGGFVELSWEMVLLESPGLCWTCCVPQAGLKFSTIPASAMCAQLLQPLPLGLQLPCMRAEWGLASGLQGSWGFLVHIRITEFLTWNKSIPFVDDLQGVSGSVAATRHTVYVSQKACRAQRMTCSLHPVGPRNQTQVISLTWQGLYPQVTSLAPNS